MVKGGRSVDWLMATVRLDQKSHALVRSVPNSFTSALANFFGAGPTDVESARKTHTTYCDVLRSNGIKVTTIAADDEYPDCIFVEDQAVIIDGYVLLPVPGAPSRVGEQPAVAEVIAEILSGAKICKMNGGAKMDGGDLLRLGDLFFVGRSSRTNDAGISELKDLLDHLGYELRIVDIPNNALHLTSISSTPRDDIILAPNTYLDETSFGILPDGCEILWMPKEEVYGCNTLGLPNGKVMIAEGYPTVKNALEERGIETIEIDMGQIREADGSLTCLSVFL